MTAYLGYLMTGFFFFCRFLRAKKKSIKKFPVQSSKASICNSIGGVLLHVYEGTINAESYI